jgi:hypothetical protein
MIDWYVEISETSPDGFKSDKYLSSVINTAAPFMNYFCRRLIEIEDWKLEDAETIFKDIIEELPIMTAKVYNKEFCIYYNNWVTIKLTDTTKQIYRDIKLEKIFN